MHWLGSSITLLTAFTFSEELHQRSEIIATLSMI